VNNVLIVQAGTGTDQIGRFDITIDKENNCIADYTWQCVPIDDTHCARTTELEEILNHYRTQTDKKYKRLVTHFKRQLTHPSRYQETELGNLFSDILCESLGLDVMLLGSGSVRGKELGPVVLYSDLTECFPYSDAIYMVTATGRQLKQMIAFMLREEALIGGHTEFYQFSDGMRVVYHRESRSFREFSLHGEPVEDDKLYRVGLQEFHYKNVEEFFSVPLPELQKNGKIRKLSTSCRDILDEYLSEKQNLDSAVCGRLVIE
jgi:5'-nucleotidase